MSGEELVEVRLHRPVRKCTTVIQECEKVVGGRRYVFRRAIAHVPVKQKCRLLWFTIADGLWVVAAVPTSVRVREGAIVGPRGAVARLLSALAETPVVAPPELGGYVSPEEAEEVIRAAAPLRVFQYADPWEGRLRRFRVRGGWECGREYEDESGEVRLEIRPFESWLDLGFEEPAPPGAGWRSAEVHPDYERLNQCRVLEAWEREGRGWREAAVVQLEGDLEWLYLWRLKK